MGKVVRLATYVTKEVSQMTNQNKGLRFELQVASLIEDELGIKLYRDL